ncbi:MAG: type 4a pilus biogenesis protein PilO [Desulfoplanes sp.]|nr:type 4a pilus biogenesis protein PilO [Desulfoplanes sp.]
MNKDILTQKLEKMTQLQRVLFLVGFVLLMGGAYWYFLLSPELETVILLHKDIDKIDKEIAKFQKISLQLPDLEKRVLAKKNEFFLAQRLLPKDAQALERLLASFEMLGQEVGVGFMSFAPGNENLQKLYSTRNVDLRIRGGFHNLMRFFDKLSRLDRLVQLQSLRLQPTPANSKGLESELIADSSLVVFRALTSAEIEARTASQHANPKKK